MRSKTQPRATLLLPTWIYSCQSVGTVNFTLPFTTSVTILISILQTFRSWAATCHLCPAYGVFISQLIRYARASSSYECFILRALRLSNKLLRQGYVKQRVRSSLRKFYGRYGDFIKQYEAPLSRMLHILDDDHLPWHPPLVRHYTNTWPFYWSGPYYWIWHFTSLREVSIEHLQRVRQRTLSPPDTLSCPTLGLASVLMLRQISPGLVLSPDFRTSLGTSVLPSSQLWYILDRNLKSNNLVLLMTYDY